MTTTTVVSEKWDAVVRSCHWLVAIGFVMNRFIDEPGDTVHVWIGWSVAALVVIRLLWGLLPASGPARLNQFFPWPQAIWAHLQDLRARKPHTKLGHNPLAGAIIWCFWLGMLGMAFTGWAIDHSSLSDSWPMEEIHENLANILTVLVVLHLLALGFMSWWCRFNYLKTMKPEFHNRNKVQ